MSGFVGIVNFNYRITEEENVIEKMNKKLQGNIENSEEYFKDDFTQLGCINEIEKESKLNTVIQNGVIYTILFNGNIYNKNEIKNELLSKGVNFDKNSDSEILLKAFIYYGSNILKNINGVFSLAIWNNKTEEIFLARDNFGIKPLYYTEKDNILIFSTQIKAILEYPELEIKMNKTGISEMIGLGPAHTPGVTLFKNIKEIKPGNFLIFNKHGIYVEEYWKLESKEHIDDFNMTCKKIRFLLEDSIKKQLEADFPVSTMLSGGLDSSIITAYASKYYKKRGKSLETYSVDYLDNDKNFVKNDFQPNSDNYFINIMKRQFNTNHNTIVIDTPELAETLTDSMIARDCPGMADVDSSLLLFCRNIKNKIAISGECSDEIFAGYPWFFREDALKSNTFPWSIAIEERQRLLNNEIGKKINLKEYVDYRYNESLSNVRILISDDKDTAQKRKISYLTMNWFMQTLLDRADKMSNENGLEIRVPFCDYRIVEYMWNVPWEIKALNGREKGLLRYVVRDLLPEEIIERKKSPYPKTHNPSYLKTVKNKLAKIMDDKNAPINSLLNKEYIMDILNTDGMSFTRPWFGQLMTGPQLMAYLIQVNMWLKKYNPKIEI